MMDHHRHRHRHRLSLLTIRRFYRAGLVLLMATGVKPTVFLTNVMADTKSQSRLLIGTRVLSPVGLTSGKFHHGRQNFMPSERHDPLLTPFDMLLRGIFGHCF